MGNNAKEEIYNILKQFNMPYVKCDDIYNYKEYINRVILSNQTSEQDKQNACRFLGLLEGMSSVQFSMFSGYFLRDIVEDALERYLTELENKQQPNGAYLLTEKFQKYTP